MHFLSLFILSLGYLSHSVFANGWTSGGGHLRQTENNPWFIQNTQEVSYCIKIDDQNFGASLAQVSQNVIQAIGYWKRQFVTFNREARLPDHSGGGFYLNLGTQEFKQVDCSEDVDLTFQFGVLTEEQMLYLNDPTSLVGIAVRTDYDKSTLKGKGFIYISPVQGPLALRASTTNKDLWQMTSGKILSLVMIHELGHVFGFNHSGAQQFELMHDQFPETVTNWAQLYAQRDFVLPNFFMPWEHGSIEQCFFKGHPLREKFNRLFGMPDHHACYRLTWQRESRLTLSIAESLGSPFVEVATLSLESEPKNLILLGEDRRTEFYLPKEQRIFPNAKSRFYTAYEGLYYKHYGSFTVTKTQNKVPVVIRRSYNRLDIDLVNTSSQPHGLSIQPLIYTNLWADPLYFHKDSSMISPQPR